MKYIYLSIYLSIYFDSSTMLQLNFSKLKYIDALS